MHLYDLSGADPANRVIFFLVVLFAIISGFLVVYRYGNREDMYIHPALQKIIQFLFRR